MKLYHILQAAWRGVRTNRLRSTLTILGIVIGIAAIIVIESLGEGATASILNQVKSFGPAMIDIDPGHLPTSPSAITGIFSDSLKNGDLAAIEDKNNVPDLKVATPIVLVPGNVSYQSTIKSDAVIMGSSSGLQEIFQIYPISGRSITQDDINSRASVAVIGSRVASQLFGLSDPVGQTVKIRNKNFRVVGVFPPKGMVSLFNVDDIVIIPYTTAQDYLLGIKYFNGIITEADSEQDVPQTVTDITRVLRFRHGITDPSKDDFHITTQADAASRVSAITSILTALLSAVAAVSLIVGGVGIMNIMLVSVTERTREIGLRKAVGATKGDIMRQFLWEAVTLTAAGGIIGVAFGALISFLISLLLNRLLSTGWSFVFPVSAALVGLAMAALIGLVFGFYPAKQAADKNPIEALRYE